MPLSRREFMKVGAIATGAALFAACAPKIGDAEHPTEVDFDSANVVAQFGDLLKAQPELLNGKFKDLIPFTSLSWLDQNPDINYGIKKVGANEVDSDGGSGELNTNTTKSGGLYFRIYWTPYNMSPYLPKEALPYAEQTLVIHELGHADYRYWAWEEAKKTGKTGGELTTAFENTTRSDYFNKYDEFQAEWVQDLYNLFLIQDPNKKEIIQNTFFYSHEDNLYNHLACVNYFTDHDMNWYSPEFMWLSERKYFTSVQAGNELNKILNKPEVPLPKLTVRDNEVNSDFINFLKFPGGGNLTYQPGLVTHDTSTGKVVFSSRDMFETNLEIENALNNPQSNNNERKKLSIRLENIRNKNLIAELRIPVKQGDVFAKRDVALI